MAHFQLSGIKRAITNTLYLVFLIIAAGFEFYLLSCLLAYPPLPCSVLLQQRHVENIMDPPSFWKFEFVGLATHQVQNLKKPKELRFQLPISFGFDIFAIQTNLLAGSVIARLSSFIVGSFLQFLNMLWVFSTCSYGIPKFLDQLISCFGFEVGIDVLFIGNT